MLALEGGEERFRRLLAEAVDLPVFHVRAILADADLKTPAGRDRALDEVAPVLKVMGDTIIRQELISEVARPARDRSGDGQPAAGRGADAKTRRACSAAAAGHRRGHRTRRCWARGRGERGHGPGSR